jgi:hypothetical protein
LAARIAAERSYPGQNIGPLDTDALRLGRSLIVLGKLSGDMEREEKGGD